MKKFGIGVIGLGLLIFSGYFLITNNFSQYNETLESKIRGYELKGKKLPKKIRLQRPSDWHFYQRAYPYGDIPKGKQLAAINQAKLDRERVLSSKSLAAFDTWEQAGPTNVPGRITDLAVHPTDPNIFWAASASGGVFKTTDFGTNWTPIFDEAGVSGVGAIAINPSLPDHVMFVGTGEAHGGSPNIEGNGIWTTFNGGTSWLNIGLNESYHIGRIVIDPSNHNRIFVAVNGKHAVVGPDRGVYRTTNAGSSWERVLHVTDSTSCIDIALHPNEGYVYAAMWERIRHPDEPTYIGGITSGIWRSTSNGDLGSWVEMDGTDGFGFGLPSPALNIGRIGLSTDPNSGRIYALYSDDNGVFMGVYRSDNYGVFWNRVDDGSISNLNGSWDGGWYFGQIRCAPGNSDIVYAMGMIMYRSTNGGVNWTEVGTNLHVDHHAMVIDPNNSDNVINGNDGGVGYSTDGGSDWNRLFNMPNMQFYAVEIDPTNPERLYGGTQDNGTNRTLTGNIDDYEEILGGDGFYVQIDPVDSDIIYAEWQNGAFSKSTDGGNSWDYQMLAGVDNNEYMNWSTPFIIDPNDRNTLYLGAQKLYKTTDAAENWTAISPDLTNRPHDRSSFGTVTTIDVSPLNSNIIYAGTDDANVWMTRDGGTNWNEIAFSTGTLPQRWVTRVVADPTDENLMYVTFSGFNWGEQMPHAYKYDYNTTSWIDISGNLPDAPVNDIIVDPVGNNSLYAATDVGVYVTSDGGTTWDPYGTGMPVVQVIDLDFHLSTRKIIAGTYGRSIYQTNISCPDPTDTDGDGIGDDCDNCPDEINPDQTDIDQDGIGDLCDDCIDPDGDGFGSPGYASATCPEDNCPSTYNPDQSDSDADGIGDVCDFLPIIRDTIESSCLSLVVSNNGNFGNQAPGGGGANMNFTDDCNGNANTYIYDGSPVIAYNDGSNKVAHFSIFGTSNFKAVDGLADYVPTVTTADYDKFESGTSVSDDDKFYMEKIWWAPKENDSCNFVVQCLKVYPKDGQQHTGLVIGEAIDWDVPSDNFVDNTGGSSAEHKLIYLRGVENNDSGCQSNDARFGGQALIGISTSGLCNLDFDAQPYGAYTAWNSTYTSSGTFVDAELYDNMVNNSGYVTSNTWTDQHAVMTFVNNYTLNADDTIWIYSTLVAVENGTESDLTTTVDKAKAWFNNHIYEPCNLCCIDLRGNADGDLGDNTDVDDLVYMVDFAFKGGDPVECLEEGDVDASGTIDVDDLVFMVDFAFKGGPAPGPCQ